MPNEGAVSNEHRHGDKIRVRIGESKGARGIIVSTSDNLLHIRLNSSEIILLEPQNITNYSLAARRAWASQPKHAGRPRLAVPRKKMVSIRINIDTWEQLGRAVEMGLIVNREQAINEWLEEKLREVFQSVQQQ